jgi:hypothetical protein
MRSSEVRYRGPTFTSKRTGVKIHFIQPGTPTSDSKEGLADSLRLVAPEEISLLRAASYLIIPYRPDENATEPVKQLREKFEAVRGASCQAKTD